MKQQGRIKRSDSVADSLKRWIMNQRLPLNEHLPNERELMHIFGVSKGTMREALKALETQGLVTFKTGPGGGGILTAVSVEKMESLLSNYSFSRSVTIRDLYAVRKRLEPELARSVIGHLTEEHYDRLESAVGFCACAPFGTEVGFRQRLAELDFHDILTDACPNAVLTLYCRFVTTLLKNLAVCHDIYRQPQRELSRRGQVFHTRLIQTLRQGDEAAAAQLMLEHIEVAERIMCAHETGIEQGFIFADRKAGNDSA